MKETTVLEHLLGTIPMPAYIAGMIFALIGTIISLYLQFRTRDKDSKQTPEKFNLWFLLRDNLMRLIMGFFISFIAFRFAPELLLGEFSMFFCLGVGLGFDRIILLIEKFQNSARPTE